MAFGIKLELILPKEPKKSFEFDDLKPIGLGRSLDNSVVIPLPAVSRKHAVIRREGLAWVLEDLGSKQGIRVNENVINPSEKYILNDLDAISIGEALIQVQLKEEPVLEEHTSMMARQILKAEENNSMGPSLLITEGALLGERYFLKDYKEFWVGREEACDCVIPDGSISRRHALFTKNWDEIWLSDNQSKNGVFVREERIHEPIRLKDGDTIRIGPVGFLFSDPGERLLNHLSQLPVFQEPPEEAQKENDPTPLETSPKSADQPLPPPIKRLGAFERFLGIFGATVVTGLLVLIIFLFLR